MIRALVSTQEKKDESEEAMTEKEAVEIMSTTPSDHTQKQRFFRGLQVLAKYDDNLEFACNHDQVFVGNVGEMIEKMTREDIIELALCGWFISQESWSHFAKKNRRYS